MHQWDLKHSPQCKLLYEEAWMVYAKAEPESHTGRTNVEKLLNQCSDSKEDDETLPIIIKLWNQTNCKGWCMQINHVCQVKARLLISDTAKYWLCKKRSSEPQMLRALKPVARKNVTFSPSSNSWTRLSLLLPWANMLSDHVWFILS